jgi:hypothetical protein
MLRAVANVLLPEVPFMIEAWRAPAPSKATKKERKTAQTRLKTDRLKVNLQSETLWALLTPPIIEDESEECQEEKQVCEEVNSVLPSIGNACSQSKSSVQSKWT